MQNSARWLGGINLRWFQDQQRQKWLWTAPNEPDPPTDHWPSSSSAVGRYKSIKRSVELFEQGFSELVSERKAQRHYDELTNKKCQPWSVGRVFLTSLQSQSASVGNHLQINVQRPLHRFVSSFFSNSDCQRLVRFERYHQQTQR